MQRLQSRLLNALVQSVGGQSSLLAATALRGNVTAVAQGHQAGVGLASYSSASQAPVLAACILERLPVVLPADPEWEVEYLTWSTQLADRNRREYSGEFAEIRKATDADAVIEDYSKYKDEIEAFENSDWRSPWRRLDQRLFMLVKPRGGSSSKHPLPPSSSGWTLPCVAHEPGETIRAAAERALGSALQQRQQQAGGGGGTTGAKVHFMGNGPAGHVAAPGLGGGAAEGGGGGAGGGGGMLFLHRAQLISGDLQLAAEGGGKQAGGLGPYSDYALAAKDELDQFVDDPVLREVLQRML